MDNSKDIALLLQHLPARTVDEDGWLQELSLLLNDLILRDFNALVQLLYRADVSEGKVKNILQQQPDADAGLLLARLLLQRQKEKEGLRQQSNNDNSQVPDEERW